MRILKNSFLKNSGLVYFCCFLFAFYILNSLASPQSSDSDSGKQAKRLTIAIPVSHFLDKIRDANDMHEHVVSSSSSEKRDFIPSLQFTNTKFPAFRITADGVTYNKGKANEHFVGVDQMPSSRLYPRTAKLQSKSTVRGEKSLLRKAAANKKKVSSIAKKAVDDTTYWADDESGDLDSMSLLEDLRQENVVMPCSEVAVDDGIPFSYDESDVKNEDMESLHGFTRDNASEEDRVNEKTMQFDNKAFRSKQTALCSDINSRSHDSRKRSIEEDTFCAGPLRCDEKMLCSEAETSGLCKAVDSISKSCFHTEMELDNTFSPALPAPSTISRRWTESNLNIPEMESRVSNANPLSVSNHIDEHSQNSLRPGGLTHFFPNIFGFSSNFPVTPQYSKCSPFRRRIDPCNSASKVYNTFKLKLSKFESEVHDSEPKVPDSESFGSESRYEEVN